MNMPESIASLDLSRVAAKLRAARPVVGGAPMDVDAAEAAYRRFLALRALHPEVTLVPTGTIDEFWHQHILDTVRYSDDCERVFGGFMDHDPYFGGPDDEAEANAVAFEATKRLYLATFGEELLGAAHRCSSKDCRGGGRSLPIRKREA
jgi:hypothetical protein